MTNGSMISLRVMNHEFLVCVYCVIVICKYKLPILFIANISSFWDLIIFMTCEERQVGGQDLRLKLQRKRLKPSQSGKNSVPGMRDLREKLSGTMTQQPKNVDPPKSKVGVVKPSGKSVIVEAPQTKRAANPAPKKKTSQKVSFNYFLFPL